MEVLKSTGKQIAGTEIPSPNGTDVAFVNEEEIKVKSKRLLEALEQELEDIKKEKEMEEQRDQQEEILQAQQKEQEERTQPLVEPTTAKKRHQMPGMAGKLDKLKKKAEIRMPPSG